MQKYNILEDKAIELLWRDAVNKGRSPSWKKIACMMNNERGILQGCRNTHKYTVAMIRNRHRRLQYLRVQDVFHTANIIANLFDLKTTNLETTDPNTNLDTIDLELTDLLTTQDITLMELLEVIRSNDDAPDPINVYESALNRIL